MRTQPAVAGAGLQGRKINVSGLEPEWLAMRLTDRARAGAFERRMGMRPPTIAELAMAARIFPEPTGGRGHYARQE
jgi:hypothetical protein